MNPNFRTAPTIVAANDNSPTWIDDYIVQFALEDAARPTLNATDISLGFFEYLLDGHVAEEDEEASRRAIALMDEYAGPGWR